MRIMKLNLKYYAGITRYCYIMHRPKRDAPHKAIDSHNKIIYGCKQVYFSTYEHTELDDLRYLSVGLVLTHTYDLL